MVHIWDSKNITVNTQSVGRNTQELSCDISIYSILKINPEASTIFE